MATALLPEKINCEYCGAELELEEKERISGKYYCPRCKRIRATILPDIPIKEKKIKKRSIFTTAFLALISPGLGHMYNGYLKEGILVWTTGVALLFLLLEIGLANTFKGLVIFCLIGIFLILLNIIHAVRLAKNQSGYILKKYNSIFYYVLWIVFESVLGTIITDTWRLKAYGIPTGSMENTVLAGDYVYVDKCFEYSDLHTGDLVVFKYPADPEVDYVKRCIAKGGQTVEIRDKVVFVDGNKFSDSGYVKYIDPKIFIRNEGRLQYQTIENNKYGSRDNFGPLKVPENNFFVLADNRDNSLDSRAWGCVPADLVVGRLLYIYFSMDAEKSIRWSRIGLEF